MIKLASELQSAATGVLGVWRLPGRNRPHMSESHAKHDMRRYPHTWRARDGPTNSLATHEQPKGRLVDCLTSTTDSEVRLLTQRSSLYKCCNWLSSASLSAPLLPTMPAHEDHQKKHAVVGWCLMFPRGCFHTSQCSTGGEPVRQISQNMPRQSVKNILMVNNQLGILPFTPKDVEHGWGAIPSLGSVS